MEEDAKRKSEEAARLAREAKLREKEKMQRVSELKLAFNSRAFDALSG